MFDENLFKEIEASKAPQKLLIVPAQLTLSAEQAAFEYFGKGAESFGFFDFHVMSGNKLRAEIIKKTGGPGRTAISNLGRSMILRKCAKDSELRVYGKMASSPEFLSGAADFIIQLKQSMSEIPEGSGELLSGKLSDMKQIFTRYESFMEGKYIDTEDGILFASEKAKACQWIKDSEIWFAGFYSFTNREQHFIKALNDASYGCHVKIDSIPESIPSTLKAVFEAGGPADQLGFIAYEILRLIREEGYAPEDIAILSGNISGDAAYYKRCFSSLGIPLYTDEKRSLMHLDAASKIAALLDIAADGYRPQTVSEYIGNEDLDKYIKLYHVKGNDFLSPFKYGGEKKIEAEKARDEFAQSTSAFIEEIKNGKTVREKTESLYLFLAESLKLPEQMRGKALSLSDEGYTEASDEHAQGWGVIVNILDQLVELLGDEELSMSEYRDIVKNAFKDIKIGLLPQKSGCIVLGDIYRTKLSSVRALFVISFNDGCIPRNNSAEGILTEAEQETLAKDGFVLCKPYAQLNKEDKASIYQAFSAASDALYFSYLLSDSEGNSLRPSYMLSGIEPSLLVRDSKSLYSLEELIQKLRDYKSESRSLDNVWKAVAAEYQNTDRYKAAVKGLLYRNDDRLLDDESKEKILKPQSLSPSGLEKYARCPYSFFISYGIRPDEDKDFSIDKQTIGNIHHEILMRLTRWLSSDGKPVSSMSSKWSTTGDEEIKAFVDASFEDIRKSDASGLLTKGPEEEYRTKRIKSLAEAFALQMVKQVRLGNIDSIASEEEFSITFAGTKLKGKIDRIDTTSLSDSELVKIIDYKSGATRFNRDLIEQGLSIQLMLYLEAASAKGEKPIGTFYFHIENPESEVEISMLTQAADEKLFKLDGAFVDDKLVYIDKTATGENESEIIKAKQKMSEVEYEALRTAFRDKLSDTITKINRGDISVKPRKLGSGEDNNSCRFCPYNSICNFDKDTEGFSIV